MALSIFAYANITHINGSHNKMRLRSIQIIHKSWKHSILGISKYHVGLNSLLRPSVNPFHRLDTSTCPLAQPLLKSGSRVTNCREGMWANELKRSLWCRQIAPLVEISPTDIGCLRHCIPSKSGWRWDGWKQVESEKNARIASLRRRWAIRVPLQIIFLWNISHCWEARL